MEFEGIYKREFGILIDFEPSIIEEEFEADEEEPNYNPELDAASYT